MKEIKLSYQIRKAEYGYPTDECDRCGEEKEIHTTTDGGYLLCNLCVRKMVFDREHPND